MSNSVEAGNFNDSKSFENVTITTTDPATTTTLAIHFESKSESFENDTTTKESILQSESYENVTTEESILQSESVENMTTEESILQSESFENMTTEESILQSESVENMTTEESIFQRESFLM